MALSIEELFIDLDFTVHRYFMCNNHHKSFPISLPFCDQQDILLPFTIPFFSQLGKSGPLVSKLPSNVDFLYSVQTTERTSYQTALTWSRETSCSALNNVWQQ